MMRVIDTPPSTARRERLPGSTPEIMVNNL